MSAEDLLKPTDWGDPEERQFSLDYLEHLYAEDLYTEKPPPTPEEFVGWHARPWPELDEPGMPPEVIRDLFERCEQARFRVGVGDESYANYRDLYGREAFEREQRRRERFKEAFRRWRESGFEDAEAFEEMTRYSQSERRRAS